MKSAASKFKVVSFEISPEICNIRQSVAKGANKMKMAWYERFMIVNLSVMPNR